MNITEKVLELFSKTNEDILKGYFILDNIDNLYPSILEELTDKNILDVNPGEDLVSMDYEHNRYGLTKYSKRLMILNKLNIK